MKFPVFIRARRLSLIGCVAVLSGCQHVDVAQITYEVLRAEDCRRNKLEDFCARTYASEYHHYVRLRQDFLRDQQQIKQHGQDELTLEDSSNTL